MQLPLPYRGFRAAKFELAGHQSRSPRHVGVSGSVICRPQSLSSVLFPVISIMSEVCILCFKVDLRISFKTEYELLPWSWYVTCHDQHSKGGELIGTSFISQQNISTLLQTLLTYSTLNTKLDFQRPMQLGLLLYCATHQKSSSGKSTSSGAGWSFEMAAGNSSPVALRRHAGQDLVAAGLERFFDVQK